MKRKTLGYLLAAGVLAFGAHAAVRGLTAASTTAVSPKAVPVCNYVVTLDSPANGAVIAGPTDIHFNAQVRTEVDGCNAIQMSFWNGETRLGVVQNDGSDYFTFVWPNVGPGTYNVSARVVGYRDDATIQVTSGPIPPPNQAPTVSMASPGGPFRLGTTIALSATASDPDGSISRVDFYQGSSLLGSDTTAPYEASYQPPGAGTYQFSAIAFDDRSASATSNVVSATFNANQAPSISITSPVHGSSHVTPATITFTASASDSDGSVSRVDFYADGVLIGQDSMAPYSISWATGARSGTAVLAASAHDDQQATSWGYAEVYLSSGSGSVTANPNPCTVYSAASPTCATTITWSANTSAAELWNVYIRDFINQEGYPEAREVANKVATGASGTFSATVGGERRDQRFEVRVGGVAVATVGVWANWAPQIAISAPAAGQVFTAPGAFTFSADATDGDGGIARVEFYRNGEKIGEDATSPYAIAVSNLAAGLHSLEAVAVDRHGASRASGARSITVHNVPTVQITSPANGAVVTAPGSVEVAATASDDNGIRRVEFFHGGQLIGQDTVAPYAVTWSGIAAGTYAITARVVDIHDAVGTSAPVSLIVNAPPQVSLTSPAGTTTVVVPGSLTLTAAASDTDGSIARVEFYEGDTYLGVDTVAPYTFSWSVATAGDRTITALAVDDRNAFTVSAGVVVQGRANAAPSITLTSPSGAVSMGAPGSLTLSANATDDVGIDRVEFFHGTTLIGEDRTAPYSLAWTQIAAGTYAVRARAVDVHGAATDSGSVTVTVDGRPSVRLTAPTDGAVVNAPGTFHLSADATDTDGSIVRVEFYQGATKIGEDLSAPYTLSWSSMALGRYSLTARAVDNQGNVGASAAVSVTYNGQPSIQITAPQTGSVWAAPANFTIQTTASDPDDGVALVEFYIDGVHRATDTQAPFTMGVTNLGRGTYSIVARAYDHNGAAISSTPITVVSNEAPQVAITSPAPGTQVSAPATIAIIADASDVDGTISRVEFYQAATLIGTATAAPYRVDWVVSSGGDHSITARAFDNHGTPTTSAAVIVRAGGNAFDQLQDGGRVDLSSELPAHDPTVGRVAGSASVSGGAASYSIPIPVPPGRRGMEPSFALEYSSRGGNGIAGMGWSLSGESAIHRCPWTLAQDGQVRAVTLTANDRICLDGQRLVRTAGTYGQSGATYATEVQSFARVTQLGGSLATSTAYFKVERKSGEVEYYGLAAVSRVVPDGKTVALSWMRDRVEDRVGNFLEYRYVQLGKGEVLLDRAVFTGFASTSGDRVVQFDYEARPTGPGQNDVSSSYTAGGLVMQTRRLKAITTRVGAEDVRQIRLDYGTGVSASTGRSLLRSVQDCAFAATWVCKTPTTFNWQHGMPTFQLGTPDFGFDPQTGRVSRVRSAGDFDGDGAAEVIVNRLDYASNTTQYHLVSLTPERTVRWSMVIPVEFGGLYLERMHDFNMDGRVDLVGRNANNELVVRFWSGQGTDFANAFATSWNTGIVLPLFGAEVAHVGDMDGDGRSDLTVVRDEPNGAASCRRRVYVHRNTPSASSPQSAPTFPVIAQPCLSGVLVGGYWDTEKVRQVSDFDGDGLPDVWINSANRDNTFSRILLATRTSTYGLTAVSFSSRFPAADPATTQETKASAFAFWTDVNGDGLDDFVYARSDNGGRWTLRLNRGGQLGPRYMFTSSLGIEHCLTASRNATQCGASWQPWLGGKITVADVDGDGRTEILVPRKFAALICRRLEPDPQLCPDGDGASPACERRFTCPEQPGSGAAVLGQGRFLYMDSTGAPTTTDGDTFRVAASHYNGHGDDSSYFMTALRFVEMGDGTIQLRAVDTNLINNGGLLVDDLYGDGQTDFIGGVTAVPSNLSAYGVPFEKADGTPVSTDVAPRSLPGGIALMTRKVVVNEGVGPAAARNPDGRTPQVPDMLGLVRDGLGLETVWTYYPLSSRAGRAAGETPFYVLPTGASRYIDESHIYFTSSMPAVSSMIQSDGVGDYREWRYAYREAMYNTRGRGFQGFRTLIEEDVANGLRTSTVFHQKFPLTSQPEYVYVDPMARAVSDGSLKAERYAWRCNRANRVDEAACAAAAGGTVTFPFLDTKETWTSDAAVAVSGGAPAPVSYVQEVNADDSACTGSFATASGFDANGNLLRRTVHVKDEGAGSGGFRRFLSDQCQRETHTYTVDTTNWWLDRLSRRTVTSKVTWDGTSHALPVGAANPTQTVTTDYVWNADRTLSRETVQPGVANQQRVTQYTYPASGNYGLPETVAVTASGDANGTRTTRTGYSSDGYFAVSITNPLQHTATTSVRLRDGQPIRVTDANGLRTVTDYDAFGFPVRVQYRGRTDAEYMAPDRRAAMTACTLATCGANTAYQVVTVQDGSPTQLSRFDVLGRPRIKAERQMDGQWSHVFTEYNARGLPARQSEPLRNGDAVFWTEFTHYDVLGRLARKVTPQQAEDGRGDRVTTYSYSGRQTSIQVCGSGDAGTANCLVMSRTVDATGRYVETRDAQNGGTRFWYDGGGNTLALEDANGSVIRAAYNAIGQRTSVNDPNQGPWSFAYNALGELLSQTDARGIVTSFGYDLLGRPKERRATVEVTGDAAADLVLDRWTYDPAGALGQEETSQRLINDISERLTTTRYDGLVRPVQQETTQAVATGINAYRMRRRYDSYYGRLVGQEYPNGEVIEQRYSAYGHVVRELDAATGTAYRVLGGTNARGQPVLETFGGVLQTRPGYSAATGQVTELLQQANGIEVRRLGYGYDVYSNVRRQTLNSGQTQEEYRYDTLHRLVEAKRTGAATGTTTYGYDAVGNFSWKSDFSVAQTGAYAYGGGGCGGGPNAVKSVQTAVAMRTYCYDANGNQVSDSAGLAIAYDHSNLPVSTRRGAAQDWFRYGPDNQRVRSWGADGSHVYLGSYEHRLDTGETKVYVGDFAVITRTGAARKVDYLLKDRLGSVDAVANAAGALTETRGYDAFGKPRSGTWSDLSPARLPSTNVTPKGFTQHEHLNQVELIHMNGRAYDYHLGRFTGVDPVIQLPLSSQALNPYAYIANNPLSGTDPTGYMAAYDDGCNRRQSCQRRLNTLTSLGAELAEVTSAGRKSAISASREFREFARAMNNGAVVQGGDSQGAMGTDASQLLRASSRGSMPFQVPRNVEKACSTYVAPAGADCGFDAGVKKAAETGVSVSRPLNADFINDHVLSNTTMDGDVVATTLSYDGDVSDSIVENAAKQWTGAGDQMKLQMIRQSNSQESLKIIMLSTPEMARKLKACTCTTAYSTPGAAFIADRTIYLNRDHSIADLKITLAHELGHYFFGYGHPSMKGDYLLRGVMDYSTKRVNALDRSEYARKYGASAP
jgi:RHS repeat-associated protein